MFNTLYVPLYMYTYVLDISILIVSIVYATIYIYIYIYYSSLLFISFHQNLNDITMNSSLNFRGKYNFQSVSNQILYSPDEYSIFV